MLGYNLNFFSGKKWVYIPTCRESTYFKTKSDSFRTKRSLTMSNSRLNWVIFSTYFMILIVITWETMVNWGGFCGAWAALKISIIATNAISSPYCFQNSSNCIHFHLQHSWPLTVFKEVIWVDIAAAAAAGGGGGSLFFQRIPFIKWIR